MSHLQRRPKFMDATRIMRPTSNLQAPSLELHTVTSSTPSKSHNLNSVDRREPLKTVKSGRCVYTPRIRRHLNLLLRKALFLIFVLVLVLDESLQMFSLKVEDPEDITSNVFFQPWKYDYDSAPDKALRYKSFFIVYLCHHVLAIFPKEISCNCNIWWWWFDYSPSFQGHTTHFSHHMIWIALIIEQVILSNYERLWINILAGWSLAEFSMKITTLFVILEEKKYFIAFQSFITFCLYSYFAVFSTQYATVEMMKSFRNYTINSSNQEYTTTFIFSPCLIFAESWKNMEEISYFLGFQYIEKEWRAFNIMVFGIMSLSQVAFLSHTNSYICLSSSIFYYFLVKFVKPKHWKISRNGCCQQEQTVISTNHSEELDGTWRNGLEETFFESTARS